jgi:predicted AlkP superfamily pyrophosphatase or phosphodiesterase
MRFTRFVGITCAFLCVAFSSCQTQTRSASQRMVVVISLDGFPAYDLENPKLPVPTLRELIKSGSWAKRMQPVNPTVTWPNHTTMITGLFPRDHGLLFNGTLVRADNPLSVKVDPNIAKDRMVHVETLYDIAHNQGLTTAQVDWVAINNASTINWAFPEKAKPSDPLVAEMISKGVIDADDVGNNGKPSILWRDQIWTKAGAYIIREHKPNLLLFHLLSLDSTHHAYGPRTLASYDAIAFLDSCVKQLIDATRDAGLLDRTTFVVVSDHGFKTASKDIHLNSLLAGNHFAAGVQAVPEGGSAMLYVEKARQSELLPALHKLLSETEGVETVAGEGQYQSLGLPSPARDSQAPDLVAFAKSGYSFSGGKAGDPVISSVNPVTGSHGYLNTDDELDAIFIASGFGIRPHVALDKITNLSVAPTLVHLLGIKLPKTEASALTALLQ